MSNNRILVTGASGYIGTHVMNLLINKNYEIHAISRFEKKNNIKKNFFWYQIDLLESNEIEKIIEKAKPKYLIHLAWKIGSGLKHESTENDNWLFVSKLLINIFYKHGGKRILVSGTCAEYDWNYNFLTEGVTPLNPSNSYGKIKNELYNYLQSYCSSNNYSFVWPRIFFSFGPNQNINSLVPLIIKNLINNEIVNTTNAEQKFDYLYIEDVALAIVLLLESEYDGAVNISSGKATKLKQIISYIAEYFDKKELIQFGAVQYPKDGPMRLTGDNEILKSVTKWLQKYSIEEGLERTIKYFQSNN